MKARQYENHPRSRSRDLRFHRAQNKNIFQKETGGLLMDGTINKGVILSIEGNTAKVAPMKDTRLVSPNIQIADNIDAATLKKGAAVAYVCFEDDTGLIFATLS